MMKLFKGFSTRGWSVINCALLATVLLTACRSTRQEPVVFTDVAPSPASGATVGSGGSTTAGVTGSENIIVNPGDSLTVSLIGPDPAIPAHEQRVKEDGTISMDLIGSIKAAGKTAGQLQKEIHDLYVPKYYTRLTVTVTLPNLAYSVGGEVKNEGPKAYLGRTTLTQAIQAAGGFTDFANKKKIRLTRSGKTTTYNWNKIQENPGSDPLVIPNDVIHVPRRFW